MSNNEQWSGDERRSEERIRLAVEIDWDALAGPRKGTISDLSKTGCFILASGFYSEGEAVSVRLPLTDGSTFEFMGQIVNHVPDLGFALRFIDLTDTQKDFLFNFAEMNEST